MTAEPTIDVVALGQRARRRARRTRPTTFVARTGVERGAMTMVDAARSDEIYAALGPATETSGGSAANTAAGVASFGGRAAFIGRIADDTFGKVFAHDLRSARRALRRRRSRPTARPTGRCLVIVDARRRAHDVHVPRRRRRARPDDVHRRSASSSAAVTYLEGYLWDRAGGQGRDPPRPRRSRTTPAARSRSRSPTRSASTATAPSSVELDRRRHRHPLRQRGRDHDRCTRSTTFDEALQPRRATTARSPRSPAARTAR